MTPAVAIGHQRSIRSPAVVSERGTGLVSSIAGVTVFLAFLFFAVQLLFNLYATSVVTANGYDGARQVASYRVDHASNASVGGAQARAEASMRDRLGRYGRRVTFDWSGSNNDSVRLRLEADNPNLLFYGSRLLGFDHIDRTIVVRVERER